MSNIITVKDMCLWYGDHKALNNVNIDTEALAAVADSEKDVVKFGKSQIGWHTISI